MAKSSRLIKIVVSVAVLGGGVGYLLVTSTSSAMEYYKHVDEVLTAKETWKGKKLQVHGRVVPGSIRKIPGTLDWRFDIQHNGHTISAHYVGIVPDTFKDNSEVVCKGQLAGDLLEVARDGVMAKCPSKYDATGAKAGAHPGDIARPGPPSSYAPGAALAAAPPAAAMPSGPSPTPGTR